MTTEAAIAYGSKFLTDNGNSPGAWTELQEVTNITPPGISVDEIDASHQQSPGASREKIPGMSDGGKVTVEMNYVPGNASALALMAEYASRPTKTRRIVFPDTSYLEFDAFLSGYEPEAPLDDKMTATASFTVTGAVTLSQAV